MGGSHPNRFERFTAATALSGSTFCKPPALPEVADLQQAGATLPGIYPGQPGRQTAQPTTEMMLWALRGVTLSRIQIDGKLIYHLTPLNAVQKRILTLMEVPLESYDGLVT